MPPDSRLVVNVVQVKSSQLKDKQRTSGKKNIIEKRIPRCKNHNRVPRQFIGALEARPYRADLPNGNDIVWMIVNWNRSL